MLMMRGEQSSRFWGNFSFTKICAIRLPDRLLKHPVQAGSGDETTKVFKDVFALSLIYPALK